MNLTKGIILKKISNANYIVKDLFDSRQIRMSVSGKKIMEFSKFNIGDIIYLQVFPYEKDRGRFFTELEIKKYFPIEVKVELDNREPKNK